jgi:HAD superfamily hydrolase (TIGR01509 family)
MGGDQIVAALAGDAVEARSGEEIRSSENTLYLASIDEVEPMAGARELIVELGRRGWPVVLASSAKEAELDDYLELLDVRELIDASTSSADVERTKPAPDLVHAALEKAGADSGVLIGDSTWDCEAARRAGIETIALLTGGFSADELNAAGAIAVFESIPQLLERIDETPLCEPGPRPR